MYTEKHCSELNFAYSLTHDVPNCAMIGYMVSRTSLGYEMSGISVLLPIMTLLVKNGGKLIIGFV